MISGKDLKVEVDKVAWRNGSPRKSKTPENTRLEKKTTSSPKTVTGVKQCQQASKSPAKNESYNKGKEIGHFAQASRRRK